MYYEIEGQLSIEPIIFDDDELIARGHHYPYNEIESLEITSAQVFSPYGILTLRTNGRDVTIPFPRSRKNKLELAKTAVLASRLNAYAPTLSAGYRIQRSKTGNADAVDSGTLSASVTIPLDSLFPWSSSAQNVASAKDSVENIELQIEDAKTSLKVSTDSYLRSIAQSKSSITSLQASVNLAKETYDMTLTAYQRGSKDLLSLQNALDDVLAAQVNLKSEVYSLISSILELENVIGVPFGTLIK